MNNLDKLPLRVVYKRNGHDEFFYTTSEEWALIWAEKSGGKIEVRVYGVGWVPRVPAITN